MTTKTLPSAPLASGGFQKSNREDTGTEYDECGALIRPELVGRLKYSTDVTESIGLPIGPDPVGQYFVINQVDVHSDGTSTAHLRHAVPGDFDRYAVRPTGAPE